MGLLDTLRNVLGLPRPLVVRDPDTPLAVSEAARLRLESLPPGQGIWLETLPAERGRFVHVTEGESQGPPPPTLDPLPISLSDADLVRLRGRVLEYRDDRWSITIPLELRARETPNPDSRLYLSDQVLATGRPSFCTLPVEADAPDLALRLLSAPGVRSVLLRENTVTVARDPEVGWDVIDRGVDAAVREHLLLCGGPAEGAITDADRDEIVEQIRAVLVERVLPGIHRDGGNLELLGYSNGVVKVSMTGACKSCPSSTMTLRMGIERTLKEAFPGQVERVEAA